MMTSSHNIETKIRKARAELLIRLPFYASILFHMKLHKSDTVNTAGVDVYGNLFYNELFLNKLNQSELMFILAHEASHVGFNHLGRAKSRDPMLWNMAIDMVTNYILQAESVMTPPEGGLLPDLTGYIKVGNVKICVKDKSSEEVYDELLQQCGSSCSKISDKLAVKQLEKVSSFDVHLPASEDVNSSEELNNNEKVLGKLKQLNPTEFWREVIVSSKQISDLRGCVLNSRLQYALDILLSPPKINWRQQIQVFITTGVPTNFTMKCPGRRGRALGLYLPTTIKEKVSIVIGLDCSGSIGHKEIIDFISECYNITKFFPSAVLKIVPWCGSVIEDKILEIKSKPRPEDFTPLINLPGGSTVLDSFIDWCNKNASPLDSIIIFTDGYVENKQYKLFRNQPVIAAISGSGNDQILKQSFKCVKIEE